MKLTNTGNAYRLNLASGSDFRTFSGHTVGAFKSILTRASNTRSLTDTSELPETARHGRRSAVRRSDVAINFSEWKSRARRGPLN